MDNQKSHDEARLTLQQFIAVFELRLETGSTTSGKFLASLRDVSIVDGSISAGAVGFGDTLEAAKASLVSAMDGRTLRIASYLTAPRLVQTFYFKPYLEEIAPPVETSKSGADAFVQFIRKLHYYVAVESVELVIYDDGESVGNCYVNFKSRSGDSLNIHLVSVSNSRARIEPTNFSATIDSNNVAMLKLPSNNGFTAQAMLVNVLTKQRPIIIHISRFDHVSAKLKSAGIEFRANVRN